MDGKKIGYAEKGISKFFSQHIFFATNLDFRNVVSVDYARNRCEKEKTFEKKFFPSRVFFPTHSSSIASIDLPIEAM